VLKRMPCVSRHALQAQAMRRRFKTPIRLLIKQAGV
jgi:hypothetical protein